MRSVCQARAQAAIVVPVGVAHRAYSTGQRVPGAEQRPERLFLEREVREQVLLQLGQRLDQLEAADPRGVAGDLSATAAMRSVMWWTLR